jgi:hypothetical protein
MMKFSEAIRLGALLHPQCYMSLHQYDPQGQITASCALGAAKDAGYDLAVLSLVQRNFHCPCPNAAGTPAICKHNVWLLDGLVTHLNDWHHWERERIADHLDRLELEGRYVDLTGREHEMERSDSAREAVGVRSDR